MIKCLGLGVIRILCLPVLLAIIFILSVFEIICIIGGHRSGESLTIMIIEFYFGSELGEKVYEG